MTRSSLVFPDPVLLRGMRTRSERPPFHVKQRLVRDYCLSSKAGVACPRSPAASRAQLAQIDFSTSHLEAVSLPFPPLQRSLPPAPWSVSLPVWPSRVSLPFPPFRLSLPPPPQIRSLPARPETLSLPPSAAITSRRAVPLSFSPPFVPTIVACFPLQVADGAAGGVGSTTRSVGCLNGSPSETVVLAPVTGSNRKIAPKLSGGPASWSVTRIPPSAAMSSPSKSDGGVPEPTGVFDPVAGSTRKTMSAPPSPT